MEAEGTIQIQEESPRLEEDWADAEWFEVWLQLARRDYQGIQAVPDFGQAA